MAFTTYAADLSVGDVITSGIVDDITDNGETVILTLVAYPGSLIATEMEIPSDEIVTVRD